jgi:hypothetical protein
VRRRGRRKRSTLSLLAAFPFSDEFYRVSTQAVAPQRGQDAGWQARHQGLAQDGQGA